MIRVWQPDCFLLLTYSHRTARNVKDSAARQVNSNKIGRSDQPSRYRQNRSDTHSRQLDRGFVHIFPRVIYYMACISIIKILLFDYYHK